LTACNQLFDLSLLIPQRTQNYCLSREITTDVLWQRLNNSNSKFSPNVKLLLKQIFDSMIVAFNYKYSLLEQTNEMKEKELKFYRCNLVKIHFKHVETLLRVIIQGQQEYNRQLTTNLLEPLTAIMTEYAKMERQPTEECLRTFLFTFKIHVDQFNELIQNLNEQVTTGVDQLFSETKQMMIKDIRQCQENLLDEFRQLNNKQEILTMNCEQSLNDLFRILNIST